MKCTVSLIGCHDSTKMTVELTKDEFAFLSWLQERSKATSTYECMPILVVEKDEEIERR